MPASSNTELRPPCPTYEDLVYEAKKCLTANSDQLAIRGIGYAILALAEATREQRGKDVLVHGREDFPVLKPANERFAPAFDASELPPACEDDDAP